MIGYYDLVLGLIPLTLLGVTGVLHGVGFETTVAVLLASLAAGGLVGHAMFVKAPVDVPNEPQPVSASD